MIHRKIYKIVRVCHRCDGSGEGKCKIRCHVCNGVGARKFSLYASDMQGATLTTYVAPPIAKDDPSYRVAPAWKEGERRAFMTAEEAHDAGVMMLANGEILSYAVEGFDDFAQLSDEDACEAWAELATLADAATEARKQSEGYAWEERENVLADLIRLGDVEIVNGEETLTPKGRARIKAVLSENREDTTHAKQCIAMAKRATFLQEKAAQ